MHLHTEHIIDLLRSLGVRNKVANRDIVAEWFLARYRDTNGTTTPEPTVAELNRRYPQLDLFRQEKTKC
jgi:hypothetical protein